MNNKKKSRLKILSISEIDSIYSLPVFKHTDREDYFSMDKEVKKFVFRLKKFEARVYFILLLGYFRVKPVIHNFTADEVKEDLRYVLDKHFNGRSLKSFGLSDKFKIRLMNRLLEHVGFERYKASKHKNTILAMLNHYASIAINPRYLFDECLAFFGQHLIVIPGYSSIVELISKVLKTEQIRINKILRQGLSFKTKRTVLEMIESKQKFTDLSKLKKASSDFSNSEVNREIQTHKKLSPIFDELKMAIKSLRLSPANLEYYASMIQIKSVYTLRRQSDSQKLLYLISYLYFRFQESNDNLMAAFVYLTRKLHEASKKFARRRVLEDINIIRKELKAAGNLLSMYIDGNIANKESFGSVRKKAFKLLSKNKIKLLSKHLNESDYDIHHYEWEYIDGKLGYITKLIRSIFLTIDFEFSHLSPALLEQFKNTRIELSNAKEIKTINFDIINKYELRFIDGHENCNKRFEYFLYRKAYQLFNKSSITVKNSIENKTLAADLIDQNKWLDNKSKIIKNTQQPSISEPISSTIQDKLDILNEKLRSVSDTISLGNSKYVEYLPGKGKLKWSIPYRRWQDSIDNPIYQQIPHLGIVELLSYVNSNINFLDGFQHATYTKEKNKTLTKDLLACTLANATNFGLYKMANISDRSIGRLRNVEETFLRAATLKDANDIVSNAIAKLPIFVHYHINDSVIFSSVDGQKFECRINTFKARFSSKDFFKGKGVSSLTLVSNHVPVNAVVTGSNEYEGHYAFDLLYNNTSSIKPNVLSTDTHGTNNVNFAILDFFGYQFAPRYKRVKNVFFDLFEVLEDKNDNPIIRLNKEINIGLIESEWDSIQHILCSLSEKTASQSTIVRKLSIGKKRTLLALQEYDRLVKAIYILDFVDNAELRHYVQQALNRGEAYHQLRRAVASVNGNKFRGGDDYKVALWNECARLVSNCIIYYNSAILSTFLKMSEEMNKPELVENIAQLSPVAWQHINLNGEYSFQENIVDIDLEMLLKGIDVFA